jgi:hypothetical protein
VTRVLDSLLVTLSVETLTLPRITRVGVDHPPRSDQTLDGVVVAATPNELVKFDHDRARIQRRAALNPVPKSLNRTRSSCLMDWSQRNKPLARV